MSAPHGSDTPAVLVQELRAQAGRLGLTWELRYATMVSPTTAVVDGDTVTIPLVNLVGAPLGARVAVFLIPPSTGYVTAVIDRPMWANENGTNARYGASGSTTSAAYANMPGPPVLTLTKVYGSTRLVVELSTTFFVATAQAGTLFGAQIASSIPSFDVDVAGYEDNVPALSTRLQATGQAYVPGVPSGLVTVTGRWLRTSGAGTPSINTDDWYSFSVREVA